MFDCDMPCYPALGAKVARLRKAKPYLAWEHGLAVLEAIRALQRRELQRELPEHRVSCASGTNHNTGKAILAAVRQQQRAKLARALEQSWKARTDAELREQYKEAMEAKRTWQRNMQRSLERLMA